MRFVVLLLFVFVLGVLSFELKHSLSSYHKQQLKEDNDDFIVTWSRKKVHGYRRASLAEITTQAFVNQYNNGKDDDDDGDVSCSLSVTDGFLLFPKNDTGNGNLMTLYDGKKFGCDLYERSGNGYFETWPDTFCSNTYNGNHFETLSVSFMQEYFYTETVYCQNRDKSITMAVFIRDSVTPSPSPSPPPTPSRNYVCCTYYDSSEQFETAFCQVSGQNCPNSMGSYAGVGNFTVNDCKDCCNKIYTSK